MFSPTGSLSSVKSEHRTFTLEAPAKWAEELDGSQGDAHNAPFFTAALLSMWDNIVGPCIQCEWNMFGSKWEVKERIVEYVASHALNGEICRTEELAVAPGQMVENKLYVLSEHNILVTAFVFSSFLANQGPCVFSLSLILPLGHLSAYLPLHKLCEERMRERVDRLTALFKQHEEVDSVLDKFADEVPSFIQSLHGIYRMALPERLTAGGTAFDASPQPLLDMEFLKTVITSHLQTCGCSIVVGKTSEDVNLMIRSLALFITPAERRCSRLLDADDPDLRYEPDLFLQGLLHDASGNVSIPEKDVIRSRMPSTLIDLTHLVVKQTNQLHKHDVVRQEFLETQHLILQRQLQDGPDALHSLCRFHTTTDRSELVTGFLKEVFQLNPRCGVREAFISLFMRRIHRKALALIKYVQSDPSYLNSKSTSGASGSSATQGGLYSNVGGAHPTVVRNLRQDLALENEGDFKIILATAEKMQPGLFIWLLGDPRRQGERYQYEFEAL